MVKDIAEMMKNWNALMDQVRVRYPSWTDEQVFQETKRLMNASLGL